MNDNIRADLLGLIHKEQEQLQSGTITQHHLMDNFHNLFQTLTNENVDLQAYFADTSSFEQAFNNLEEPWRFAIASYIFLGQVSHGGFGQFLLNTAGFAPVVAAFVDCYGSPSSLEHFDEAYNRLYTEDFLKGLQKMQGEIAQLDLSTETQQQQAQQIAQQHIGLLDSHHFDNWFNRQKGVAEFILAMIRLIEDNETVFFI
ncbi:MAG: hypothetical protein ACK5MJ_08410 [Alphaproteobacteria bacterium]